MDESIKPLQPRLLLSESHIPSLAFTGQFLAAYLIS